jgi:hypothetical protein
LKTGRARQPGRDFLGKSANSLPVASPQRPEKVEINLVEH